MCPDAARRRALESMRIAVKVEDSNYRSFLASIAETWAVIAQTAEDAEPYVNSSGARRRAAD